MRIGKADSKCFLSVRLFNTVGYTSPCDARFPLVVYESFTFVKEFDAVESRLRLTDTLAAEPVIVTLYLYDPHKNSAPRRVQSHVNNKRKLRRKGVDQANGAKDTVESHKKSGHKSQIANDDGEKVPQVKSTKQDSVHYGKFLPFACHNERFKFMMNIILYIVV